MFNGNKPNNCFNLNVHVYCTSIRQLIYIRAINRLFLRYIDNTKMKQLAETFSPSLTALLLGIVTNYMFWGGGNSSTMTRVTEFHPVKASPDILPTQSPTLIPTRTVPAGIP